MKATLLKSYEDQPNWCKKLKSVSEYNGYQLGQLVLDMNGTLARIVHISIEGDFRLSLIDQQGNQFAEVTAMSFSITPYNWKQHKESNAQETDKEQVIFPKYLVMQHNYPAAFVVRKKDFTDYDSKDELEFIPIKIGSIS